MLLFFSIVLLCMFSTLILILSDVKLIIENIEFSNSGHNEMLKYSGKVGIYFLGKIKLYATKIDSDKDTKISDKRHINRIIGTIKKDNTRRLRKVNVLDVVKKGSSKIIIDKFNLRVCVDTEDVVLTSYIVGIISAIIPNFVRNYIKKYNINDYRFEIYPIYKNKNYIYLKLNSIISIKVVHIISMLKTIGGISNERTSNRRSNVNCYGKY